MSHPTSSFKRSFKPPFKLLIFDWDGTLMDSVAVIVACAQAMLRELGLPAPPDSTIRNTVGLGLRETIDQLVPGCDAELYQQVLATYRAHWLSTYQNQPLLFPGVPEMLRRLAAEGYLLGVATGKSRRGLEYALESSGLRGLFNATRTVDEAPSKPHPGMLFDILSELGVQAAEAVMIGDTVYDLEMARAARMAGLGVLSGSQGREELERFEPLACLPNVVELPDWLAGTPVAAATSSSSR
jgi:phosphoglycolate phosphatase